MPVGSYVTRSRPTDSEIVRQPAREILADLPDALIVRWEQEPALQLRVAGVEINEMVIPPLRLLGTKFATATRLRRSVRQLSTRAGRTTTSHNWLDRLRNDWLADLASMGAEVMASLPGDALTLRLMPENRSSISKPAVVDGSVSYRPAMKLSPKLRQDRRPGLDAADLAMSAEEVLGDVDRPVEITVFPGESVDALAENQRGRRASRSRELPDVLVLFFGHILEADGNHAADRVSSLNMCENSWTGGLHPNTSRYY